MQEIRVAKITETDITAGKILGTASRLKKTISNLKDEDGGVRNSGETQEILAEWERHKATRAKPAAVKLEEGEKAELKGDEEVGAGPSRSVCRSGRWPGVTGRRPVFHRHPCSGGSLALSTTAR